MVLRQILRFLGFVFLYAYAYLHGDFLSAGVGSDIYDPVRDPEFTKWARSCIRPEDRMNKRVMAIWESFAKASVSHSPNGRIEPTAHTRSDIHFLKCDAAGDMREMEEGSPFELFDMLIESYMLYFYNAEKRQKIVRNMAKFATRRAVMVVTGPYKPNPEDTSQLIVNENMAQGDNNTLVAFARENFSVFYHVAKWTDGRMRGFTPGPDIGVLKIGRKLQEMGYI